VETQGVAVAEMSLADLVGQSMVLPLYGSSAATVTADQEAANRSIYGAATPAEVIRRLRPGGVVLLDRIPFHPDFGDLPLDNAVTATQLSELTGELQAVARAAGLPELLIVADQEGGRVNRRPVAPLPAPAVVGATGRPELARRSGELTGHIAAAMGVNVVFGPVADIGTSNAGIGDRSFGSDPSQVADMVAATAEGITGTGVGSVVKHWPGHGRADADSHEALPTLDVELADWQVVEAPPFRAAVAAGVDAVAVAHLRFPAADPEGRAATMSPPLLERLRRDTAFSGVVFSDALWMPAIRDARPTDAETAAAVLAAGVDVLLAPPDPAGTIALISRSPARDEIRSVLEQAVVRSLSLRKRVSASRQFDSQQTDWSLEIQQLRSDIESGAA
jgi:beta-N-acetylhexosaminidase